MTTKLVLRVLDAFGDLLGWTEVRAEARGDGTLRASQPVSLQLDRAGTPHTLSIHWADVNVEVRVPCERAALMAAGSVLSLEAYTTEPMIRLGAPAGGLPPVTVRALVAIGVPTTTLGTTSGMGSLTPA